MTTTTNNNIKKSLQALNIKDLNFGVSTGQESFGEGAKIDSYSPVDGALIGSVTSCSKSDYDKVISTSAAAFEYWRKVPAPKRGEIVRQYGERLRKHKQPLGELVSYEMGKSLQEGLGEVQELSLIHI